MLYFSMLFNYAVNKDLCNKRSIIVSEHNYNLLSNNNSEKQAEAQYKTCF
jgi:hypothetical protein